MNKTAVVFLIASFGVAVIFVFLLTMSSTGTKSDTAISGVSDLGQPSTSDDSSNNDAPQVAQDVDELSIETLVEGSGESAEDGNTLVVHYSGTLLDGTPFDNSYDKAVWVNVV